MNGNYNFKNGFLRKKIIVTFLSGIILAISCFSYFSSDKLVASASTFSYAVMDLNTGELLEARNENSKQSIASLTKIVTAITVLENIESLETEYFVPKSATLVEGSSIYLTEGESVSIKELLYGLMLRSGNDSATMLSQIVGGGLGGFSTMMNELASSVGANNSNFVNPHGLEAVTHLSTALDLCLITKYAMQNETFAQIVSSKMFKGNRTIYQNKNKMLWDYEGANGVKTGFTTKSGRCLVTTATRGDKSLVCVVLNCPDMWNVSENLLDKFFVAK